MTKDSVKSLILVDSALRIVCHGKHVTLTAQSNNGKQLLPYLQSHVQNCDAVLIEDTHITYNEVASDIDEASKLIADNAFSALRSCINSIKSTTDNPFSVFLGGVFATTWSQILKRCLT